MNSKFVSVGLLAVVAAASFLDLSLAARSPADCFLKPDPGPCKAAFKRYFYNSTSGRCEAFTYGGCHGNGNRFKFQKKCRAKCPPPPPPQPTCTVEGANYSLCASACALPTCDNPTPVPCIALCVPGCSCPSGQIVDVQNNRCVLPESCPQRTCSVKGQKYFSISAGECVPCTGTCEDPNPICTLDCRSGCGCPRGTVLNDDGTECIHPRTCPRKCERNGQVYQPGDKWNCTEGGECQFCWCLANGFVFNTTIGCPEKESCKLPNGTEVPHSATFSITRCVDCECDDGNIACALRECPSQPGCSYPTIPEGECCPVCLTCSVKGQRYFSISAGECVPCTGTCEDPNPICTRDCRSGCGCPRGTVLNDDGTECIHPRTCPRKCERNGQVYHPGDKWNCTEKGECKFCECLGNGFVFEHDQGCPEKSCQLPNGTEVQHGDVIETSPCVTCTCDDGDVNCSTVKCATPACGNPVVPPGGCCAVCPEHCTISNGTVIQNGQTYKSDPCTTCTCVDGEERCYAISCIPPSQCQWGYSQRLGECCPTCNPPPNCNYVKCAVPSCASPSVVVPADRSSSHCCDTCGCQFGSKLYRFGETFEIACQQCECQTDGSFSCAPQPSCH